MPSKAPQSSRPHGHYDPRYGTSLNGASRVRLEEIVDFIQHREAQEADSARPSPLRP